MLRDTLVARGIAADRVSVIPDEQQAIDTALRLAEPGDLVLLFADALARSWKQVVHFRTAVPADASPTPASAHAAPPLAAPPAEDDRPSADLPTYGDDVVLVRDERGVHIARETDD